MPSLRSNPRLLCTFHGLQMTLFPVAIITLFWKHRIGLSMTDILLLQGLFGLSVAVFEFPSGYLADRLGYRRSLLIASTLEVAGWLGYCFASGFFSILAAEVVLGLGMSLISGTDQALMYESLRETGREGEFRRWDGRFRFFGQSAEATAALVAGLLYVAWPRLPFVLQVVVWVANFVVAWQLVEPARHLSPPGGHLPRIVGMFRTVLGGDRKLAAVVLLTMTLGMSSFIPVWLVPLYAIEAGVPEAWIGPIWAVANYTVAISALFSDRIVERFGLAPTLLACIGLIAFGYAGLAMTFAVWGFVFYFALTIMRGLFGPALLHEEQRLVPSTDRAGFLSMRSLMFRGTFFVIGPLIGLGIDRHGQHPVLLVVGLVLVSVSLVAWFLLRGRMRPDVPGAA